MKTKFGFPVINADNVFEVFSELGINKWEKIKGPIPLEEYLKTELSSEERAELRFVPKHEVMFFKKPDGGIFRGFRMQGGPSSAVVFTLLPYNLLVICAEFRHGCEDVSLNLPGGHLDGSDASSCAKEEFKQETGIVLKEAICLLPHGTTINTRGTTYRDFSFIGLVDNPPVIEETKLDENEFLKIALIPLEEWLKLIDRGKVIEDFAIVVTFLALRYLERIKKEKH